MHDGERYALTVGDRGRVVLPASLRRRLCLQPGERIILTVQADGRAEIVTARQLAREAMGMFRDVAPGRSLVDELIAERRAEQAREDQL
jgi:AbrB family looped-hinge helix DNA binding protein